MSWWLEGSNVYFSMIWLLKSEMRSSFDKNLQNLGYTDTPPMFDMEPENDGFQKESPFPADYSQVPC